MDGSFITGKGQVINRSDATVQCWVQDESGPTIFMLGPKKMSLPERDVDCFRGYCLLVPRLGVSPNEVKVNGSLNWFKLKNGTVAIITGSGSDLKFELELKTRAKIIIGLAAGAAATAGTVVSPGLGTAAGGGAGGRWAYKKFSDNHEMTDEQADKAGEAYGEQARKYSDNLSWGLPVPS